MKKVAVIFLVILFSLSVFSQEGSFDFSKYEEDLDKIGIPTMEKVEQLKEDAETLFNNGEFEKAEKALEDWAYSANFLSNIIQEGLQPFYGALRSEREDFPYTRVSALIPYEGILNDLRQQRNKAYIMRAESLAEIGEKKESIALYREVLNLISLDNWEDWIRATNGLYTLIEIPLIEG